MVFKLNFSALILLLAHTFFLSSFSDAQTVSATVQIAAVNKVYEDSFNEGNAAMMAEQFSIDAMLMPPGSLTIQGHENIQTFWQGLIDTGVKVVLTTDELLDQGQHAYERGSFKIIAPDQTVVDEGKFIVIWTLTTNGWKLHRDIWNSNQ